MYLDPAFGGMLLQIILALAVVGGTMIFTMKRKARKLLSKKSDTDYSNIPAPENSTEDGVVDMMQD